MIKKIIKQSPEKKNSAQIRNLGDAINLNKGKLSKKHYSTTRHAEHYFKVRSHFQNDLFPARYAKQPLVRCGSRFAGCNCSQSKHFVRLLLYLISTSSFGGSGNIANRVSSGLSRRKNSPHCKRILKLGYLQCSTSTRTEFASEFVGKKENIYIHYKYVSINRST